MLNEEKMKAMYDYQEESMILEKMKKRWQCENENKENDEREDRLSDLPDCVLLHILSFSYTKHVVRTCVLSKRWRHLWKRIPTLILHMQRFSFVEKFDIFVSKILSLRDTSAALHSLNLDHVGVVQPQLLKKIIDYICSHKTHIQELGISVRGDSCLIMSCVSSCHALTSLKLSLHSEDRCDFFGVTFPKSLNLPALTSLELTNFRFCCDESGCSEPFLAFTKLNNLFIRGCKLRDTKILRISSKTLVNLAMHNNSTDIATKIELSTPSLCTFAYTSILIHKICGSGLSSVKQVNVHYSHQLSEPEDILENALVIFSWLLDLANVESLTVTSTVLQILSLVPDLFEVKLSSLCNLKSLEVELIPLCHGGPLSELIKDAMLKKAAAKSHKEVAQLRKAFEACLEPPVIPDEIVDFLRQNSRLVDVNIRTDYPDYFNLKQVEESIKGAKIIKYSSQFATSASTAPASAAESASAAALAVVGPPNLHICPAGKDDKSSNEDKVEKHQLNTDLPLPDNGK